MWILHTWTVRLNTTHLWWSFSMWSVLPFQAWLVFDWERDLLSLVDGPVFYQFYILGLNHLKNSSLIILVIRNSMNRYHQKILHIQFVFPVFKQAMHTFAISAVDVPCIYTKFITGNECTLFVFYACKQNSQPLPTVGGSSDPPRIPQPLGLYLD